MKKHMTIKVDNEKEANELLNHAFKLGCFWPNESRKFDNNDCKYKFYQINEEGCICILDEELEKKYPSSYIIPLEIFIKIEKINWLSIYL